MRSLQQRQLTILISLALVRGFLYLSLFPPWLAPDEPAHFEAVRILGLEGQSPTRNYYFSAARDTALIKSFQTFRFWELAQRPTPTLWLNNGNPADIPLGEYPYIGQFIYAETYPILPHTMLAPILAATRRLDIETQLYLLRLVSVLCSVIIVIITWWITQRLFPEEPQFWLAIPAFVVFLPMYSHIFAAVNTDVFAGLLGALLLGLLVAIFTTGATPLKLFLILLLVMLALFIKRSVLFVIPWTAIALVVYAGFRQHWSAKKTAVATIVPALLISGLIAWFVADSELSPATGASVFNLKLIKGITLINLIDSGVAPLAIAKTYAQAGVFFFITFWGAFGWASINIPWPLAWAMMVGCTMVMFGAGWYLLRIFRIKEAATALQRAIMVVFVVGTTLGMAGTFVPLLIGSHTWSPAARYIYPVIIPIATLFFLGVWQLCPTRYRQTALLPFWLGMLVLFDTFALTKVIIPYLYG